MRIAALATFLAIPGFGCSCSSPSVCDLVNRPVVFIGEVVDGGIDSLADDPWNSKVAHARFKVLEAFRGLPPGTSTVDVQLMLWPGMCSPIPYHSGKTYLVVPQKREGVLSDGVCFSGRDVNDAPDTVRYVRDYFAGKIGTNFHGRIAAARLPEILDYLVDTGEAKPLEGVRVSATQGTAAYSTVSTADGKYFLALPRPGAYKVKAFLSPYAAEPERELSVSAGGCAVRNFALSTDNTISGRVWDGRGQPVMNAKLGLIDIDRPARSESITRFSSTDSEPDGSYEFRKVPLGRYLLLFNPDGPQKESVWNRSSFEHTYYPQASGRAGAKIIEVQSDHVHLTGMDVAIGSPVDFRQVSVKVVLPDGSPWNTAVVDCVGEPLETGDIKWRHLEHVKKGSVQFFAPANRTLRIEVNDWYGRELKADYSATYKPGSTPITRTFIVKP